MSKEIDFAKKLIDYCYNSPTAFHAVMEAEALLVKKGFVQIHETDEWKLKAGGKYYFTRNNSALMAFVAGSDSPAETGFRIVGAHTDSPGFRIKPSPDMGGDRKYFKLNTEVYGGPLLNTWFDRPLGIAGRVAAASSDPLCPEIYLINIVEPLCIIPNLAPHMNSEANNGFKLNQQIDTLPLLAVINEKFEADNYLVNLIADQLEVDPSEILDFDLYLYDYDKGCVAGTNDDFISCGHIDDLSSVHAGISALCDAGKTDSTAVMVCFDNEEVGSSTMQGAGSQMLAESLERIVYALKGTRADYFRALASSFIVSADGAHAIHPNQSGKCDPTSQPVVNRGLAIKVSASRSYTSDSSTSATFQMICKNAGVKVQHFVNRSDMRGGSTIGPISSAHVSIRSVDIGLPMLAMHSIRELCGVNDHYDMYKALTEFFKS